MSIGSPRPNAGEGLGVRGSTSIKYLRDEVAWSPSSAILISMNTSHRCCSQQVPFEVGRTQSNPSTVASFSGTGEEASVALLWPIYSDVRDC